MFYKVGEKRSANAVHCWLESNAHLVFTSPAFYHYAKTHYNTNVKVYDVMIVQNIINNLVINIK